MNAVSIPTTVEAFLALRKKPRTRALIDEVEALHLELIPNPQYHQWVNSYKKDNALTGNVLLDRGHAARMIQELAADRGKSELVGVKMEAQVIRLLERVLNRYEGVGTSERKRTLNGSAIADQSAA